MDNRHSRIAKYYSSLDQWDRRLFDKLTDQNFRHSVRYVIFMTLNASFIMVTNDQRIFVYGKQVCSWLSLTYDRSSVKEITELQYQEVKQIDWGCKFFVILTATGKAYMASAKKSNWGTDKSLKMISSDCFHMIACGLNHILLLRSDGKVFTMGDNRYGQLGSNDLLRSLHKNTMLDTGLSNVDRIACGSDYSIAMIDRKLYSWGRNHHGQLGINHVSNRNVPKKIMLRRTAYSHRIIDIVAGSSYTIFLYDDGDVYACGNPDCYKNNQIFPKRIDIDNVVAIGYAKFGDFFIFFTETDQCFVVGHIDSIKFVKPTILSGIKTFNDAYLIYKILPYSFNPIFLNIPQPQQSKKLTTSVSNLSIDIDRFRCSICCDREVQIVFSPCQHLTSCEQCSKRIDDCPICRTNIDRRSRVYIP
ncbi:RCC1 and BTB domain-containing protein 1-like [Dermatophagoides pteronyssinus]|uniref:RCC1 and BTB domain-containing protein 1-like n=1 Tax=Dermatophagoides pteronyssinus TaxID=6956 RepID=A0A6P6YCY0_DERPT|nr:RCC1 and BTB domain-containing protein 1-like [Dermatophagoides pteronyssinus]